MNRCLARCPWIQCLLCTGGLMVAWRTSGIKQIDSFFKQWHVRFVISNMQLCDANFPEILVFHCTGHTWNTFAWGSCLVSAFGHISLATAALTSKGLFLPESCCQSAQKCVSLQIRLLYLCCTKSVCVWDAGFPPSSIPSTGSAQLSAAINKGLRQTRLAALCRALSLSLPANCSSDFPCCSRINWEGFRGVRES